MALRLGSTHWRCEFPKKIIDGVHYPFDKLSDRYVCQVCGKPIKDRLVRQKQTPPQLCYRHWIEAHKATRSGREQTRDGRAGEARRRRVTPEVAGSSPARSAGGLVAFAAILAACSAPEPAAPKPAAPPPELEITELAPGAVVVTSQPFAANSLVLETAAGELILVDTPTTPADTAALLGWARQRWGKAPRWAIGSHWHADASGGNQVLLEQGAEVISSRKTAGLVAARGAAMRDELIEHFAARDPETAAELRELRPTPASRVIDIEGRAELDLGGERVWLVDPGPSHSPDSIGIFFPDRRLLYGGCAVRSDGRIINRREADPNWAAAVQRFVELDPARVVPGHGLRFDPAMLPESIAAARALFAP